MIEVLKQALEALEKSQSALAEELSAWDIDPPLHHVQESHDLCGPAITSLRQAIAELESQEPVATLEDLEQEIYENTREFVSRRVMEWMLKRYYTTPPQRTEQEPVKLPCCGYTDASAVKWNPFNRVVQCHNCGQTYTQPQRTWVGLTDEEENEYNYLGPDMHWVIQEIAAKLKEKNT
jgi:hypothetical protein